MTESSLQFEKMFQTPGCIAQWKVSKGPRKRDEVGKVVWYPKGAGFSFAVTGAFLDIPDVQAISRFLGEASRNKRNLQTVYIASRFRNIPAVKALTEALKEFGIAAIQTWPGCELARPHPEAAVTDLSEINQADAIIVLSMECEAVPGGLWWEAGYAQGQGKPVYVIGPPVNIFCEHPGVARFADVESFLQEVREQFYDANPPTGGCWICRKRPGQPPEGCNGHYLNPGQPGALDELLAQVRKIPVTPEMREAQIRSFAYGNVALSNSLVTPELIDREADKLKLGCEA